ncbi:MAG: DUF1501 domain-containing protein [Verrucomicrobiota bacterium]
MLTISGNRVRNCDGKSRRAFVKAGSLGLAGLTLPQLLRAEGGASSQKAIIHIHMDGGPPQMDMIDPKPEAPVEIRGEFNSIPTKLPGYHVTELMPKTAQIADKIIFLRSLVGAASRHDAFQCQSGFDNKSLAGIGGRPAMGCIVNQLLGSPSDVAPAFVDIMQGRGQVRRSARPGFLGPVYKPFQPDISHMFHRQLEDGMLGELARLKREAPPTNLKLSEGVTLGRLDDRLGLLSGLDSIRAEVDGSGSMIAKDEFTQQAVKILTSGRMAKALDLESEDPAVLDKFTPPWSKNPDQFYTAEGPLAARKLLLARRLVEAGVRVVSVSISDWDTHRLNFSRMRDLVPIFDHAFHALVTDLEERGMLDDVTVLAWGEFGRTPKINTNAGRDHWPRVAMGMMAGGGMNVGQVIGATDKYASEATERPIHYQDVIATLYHNLGIDAQKTTVMDPTGRPQFLVDVGQPIREVI